ncbi:MAG: Sua5/YciO/YrdC/YwlC family protein [Buchnera aphidicola (Eriosoma harunire)]
MFINNKFIEPDNLISLTDTVKELQKNNVIVYPTESMFGLGCDPDSYSAVMKLLHMKKRNIYKGFILISAYYRQLQPYILERKISINHKKKMFSHWPGHITFLLPANDHVPYWLVGRSNFIAARITKHPIVRKLCIRFGKALISTSANITGKPPCLKIQDIYRQFGRSIAFLNGAIGRQRNPSQIINIITGEIIRRG